MSVQWPIARINEPCVEGLSTDMSPEPDVAYSALPFTNLHPSMAVFASKNPLIIMPLVPGVAPKAIAKSPSAPVKMKIRKGDTVQVINGKEKGKTGEVLKTLPNENRVIVQGINLRTKHVKPTQEGESGRIVTEEFSLHASNVMIYSTKK